MVDKKVLIDEEKKCFRRYLKDNKANLKKDYRNFDWSVLEVVPEDKRDFKHYCMIRFKEYYVNFLLSVMN